jgi:hypothetical protein
MSTMRRNSMGGELVSPRLSLAEAYLVAQSFLGHIRAVPSRVEEPVDGIVELEGAGLLSRVKFQRSPISQGAVLALLKAADGRDTQLALFSVTGFTDAAIQFAANRTVALFDLTADGEVVPITNGAQGMLIDEPFVSPLSPAGPLFDEVSLPEFIEDDEDENDPFFSEPSTKTPNGDATAPSWRECPQCGTKHHQTAEFCAACGTDLTRRTSALLHRGTPAAARAIPKPTTGGPTLRCKTCGSHDIELVPGT